MSWTWMNPDARPISEYLQDYNIARKKHIFLYYCRGCIRNFDTTQRVEKCPKCSQTSIIELPKAVQLGRKRTIKKYGREDFARDILKVQAEFISMLAQLQLTLWRIKIAMYYFLMPALDELK